jgi:hypothetical protein
MNPAAPDRSAPPGFWRRIKLHPSTGVLSAGLEDNFHRFRIEFTHADGLITGLQTHADRFPWSTCPAAGTFLAEQTISKPLQVVARLDPHSHCTHFFELLVVGAAHALDAEPTVFDIRVPDRKDGRTRATLSENGQQVLYWEMNGTRIEGPGEWAGRDLRQLSTWKHSLSPELIERAVLLRRVVHISNGRTSNVPKVARAADRGSARIGACFTYQMPRALDALASPDSIRDFSCSGIEPLHDFNPEAQGSTRRYP